MVITITMARIEILKAVDSMSSANEFGVAPVQKIMDEVGKHRGAVAKLIWILSKAGFIENPMRGCWRLTESGRKVLKDLQDC